MNTTWDPISLEIHWGRLRAIVDEAGAALIRTAFSPIVREGKDFAILVMDAKGRAIVQTTQSVPAFIGTMPRTMAAFLKKYPMETWHPGDVVATNDPWDGAGHLPDLNLAMPVFRNGRVIAFVGVIAHLTDVGGRGFSADAGELFEEGLQIPVSRLQRDGEINQDLMDIIGRNSRVPVQVLGDIEAMISVGESAATRLLSLLDESGLADIDSLASEIHGRSEAAMREAIRKIPEGVYEDEVPLDGLDAPLVMKMKITVANGAIRVSFDGSSPQVRGGINSTMGFTYSYTVHALKSVLDPSVPNNDGTNRPFLIEAPEGSIFNCTRPAAVAARSQVGHFICCAIHGALSKVLPGHVIADSSGPRPMITFTGQHDDGRHFVNTILLHGGMGATPQSDGIACIAFPTNTAAIPVEIIEATTPLRVEEKQFLPASGGTGKYRGGLGQRIALRVIGKYPMRMLMIGSRHRFGPRGMFGGEAGAKLRASLNGEPLTNTNGVTLLQPGDLVVLEAPGGGGYGNAAERPEALARADRANGIGIEFKETT
ncbi:MAG: hydantoinase B/oxoprolinase family protein [Pseudomonadota bacterium]